MQVGQVLREARLQRGLDLYEVKRVTKISVPALRAMEEDRWESLPADEAEEHLEGCSYCRTRYRFETSLRQYVRQTCVEQIDPALKAKLVALRTPLN